MEAEQTETQGTGERAYRLFYEHGQFSLQEQRQRHATIEGKANWVLGFAATLIGIMGLLLPEAALWSRIFAISAGFCFLGTAIWIYLSLRVRDFETAPTPAQLNQLMDQHSEDALREWTAIAIAKTAESNDKLLVEKGKALKWAMHLFVVEAVLVSAVAISVAFK